MRRALLGEWRALGPRFAHRGGSACVRWKPFFHDPALPHDVRSPHAGADVAVTASVPGASGVLALDGARYAGDASAKLEAWVVRTGPFEIAAGGAALVQFRPRVPPPGAYAIASASISRGPLRAL